MMLSLLLSSLLPLGLLMGLGYVAGRWGGVDVRSMAILVIFFISPVVFFGAVAQINLDPSYLLLPLFMFGFCLTIAMVSYTLSKKYFTGTMPNLIGMASTTGNTGYFGLPLILILFGPERSGIYLLANLGFTMAEVTVGYYLGARGNYSVLGSIGKVLKLPVLHSIWLALLWNQLQLPIPTTFLLWWERFTGAWIIIGMMLIGVALGQVKGFVPNGKMLSWLGVVKFLVWPLFTTGLVWMDQSFLQLYDPTVRTMILILGIVPLAGNTVAYAAQLDIRPGETALAVLLSTLFALLYIPVAFWLLIPSVLSPNPLP